jgi:hypothetical protein
MCPYTTGIHAQPCLSVQLCIQGLGDSACFAAGVLILVLLLVLVSALQRLL